MIWGVGTGRCGTGSLAKDLGGFHEPEPWLRDQPVRWYHHQHPRLEEEIIGILEGRMALGAPAVVDLHQSYVIPLIRKVDPKAKIYWMIREPVACLGSLLLGSPWREHDKAWEDRIYPKQGWSEDQTRVDKGIYFWLTTNTIIYREFENRQETWNILSPEMLKSHTHQRKEHYRFTTEEIKKIKNSCSKPWEVIRENLGEYI